MFADYHASSRLQFMIQDLEHVLDALLKQLSTSLWEVVSSVLTIVVLAALILCQIKHPANLA